jgi:hypothetical protein
LGDSRKNLMALPARSEVRKDVLPLQRAMRALEDARQSLKRLGGTGSVEKDAALAERVKELRRGVKKSRKLAQSVAREWFDSSTY